MKKTKEQNTNKGITLIALVITIIVMLILVGVTISMAVNGGLFNYAGKAVGDTKNALDAEGQIANGGIEVDGKWYNTIDEYLGKTETTAIHSWTRTEDTVTCSHCNESYDLGEEIPYIADAVTTPYTLTAEKSGLGEAITNDEYEVADFDAGQVDTQGNQTITQETGLTWVVLGIDDEDGDGINETLLITTSEPVGNYNDSTRIYFYGKAGYNNAVDELNNICETLYSNSTYGKARSMTIDDVNECLNFTPVGGQYYDGTKWTTTGNLTTKLKDLSTFSTITSGGTFTPDGKNTAEALGEYVLNGYEYYLVDTLELGMDGTDETTEITQTEKDLIFLDNYYWLASAGVLADGGCAHFGPGSVTDDGYVCSYYGLFYSSGNGNYAYNACRPVVSLKSDIPS